MGLDHIAVCQRIAEQIQLDQFAPFGIDGVEQVAPIINVVVRKIQRRQKSHELQNVLLVVQPIVPQSQVLERGRSLHQSHEMIQMLKIVLPKVDRSNGRRQSFTGQTLEIRIIPPSAAQVDTFKRCVAQQLDDLRKAVMLARCNHRS